MPELAATCYHCALPIPAGARLSIDIDGSARPMCCPGCCAAAELIVAGGLGDYYRYREEPAARPLAVSSRDRDELLRLDRPALQRRFARSEAGGLLGATLSIEGMRCAACAWLLERVLGAAAGVASMSVNLAAGRGDLVWNPQVVKISDLLATAERVGYRLRPYRPDAQESLRRAEQRDALIRLGVAGLGMMQVMMFAVGLYAGAIQGMESVYRDLLRWVSVVVTTPVVLVSARPFFSAARRDLALRRVGMDVPVAAAIAIAYVASLAATVTHSGEVYFESVCMFTFFLALGRYLEMRARHRGAAAIEAALRRSPATANRIAGGTVEVVAAEDLVVGDRVLVRPGDSVPADGRVIEGRGAVDESMLTGEHWPCFKRPGDSVAGGTRNGDSPLTVVVEHTGADTVLAGIVRLIDRAGSERPRIAELADRAAALVAPALLVLAAATAAWWYSLDPSRALWVTLSVLVVTCPCALSLATPAALAAATGGLLERGFLVTRAHVLESLAKATDVVFDKTGTLTRGCFRILRRHAVADLDLDTCTRLAALLEARSEHPIARAFDRGEDRDGSAARWLERGADALELEHNGGPPNSERHAARPLERGADVLELERDAARQLERGADVLELERDAARQLELGAARGFRAAEGACDVIAEAGCGVEGSIEGRRLRIGRPDWVAALASGARAAEPFAVTAIGGPAIDVSDAPAIEAPAEAGVSWVLLGDERGPLAWFGLDDGVRSEAARSVATLAALGVRIHVASGDSRPVVATLAASLGIESFRSRATPLEKLEMVRRLQRSGGVVVMVGDGINDTPGLGGAQVSVAMAGGSDLAMSRSDAVLLRDDLEALVEGFVVARRARRVIAQNLAWALLYNLAALPLAVAGLVPPYQAAIGMSASSLLVVCNALRLGRASGRRAHSARGAETDAAACGAAAEQPA